MAKRQTKSAHSLDADEPNEDQPGPPSPITKNESSTLDTQQKRAAVPDCPVCSTIETITTGAGDKKEITYKENKVPCRQVSTGIRLRYVCPKCKYSIPGPPNPVQSGVYKAKLDREHKQHTVRDYQ